MAIPKQGTLKSAARMPFKGGPARMPRMPMQSRKPMAAAGPRR